MEEDKMDLIDRIFEHFVAMGNLEGNATDYPGF